ncbi:MAG: methylated-DNA--[protein]-cysteine S-methyltransferase [Bacillota bacterium]|jgi:methylated-DNA-[protein]-cysteine S-methyltransferase
MQYTTKYQSPIGEILLAGDDTGLTGLWFKGEKYYANNLAPEHETKEIRVFAETKRWLDIYFSGQEPNFLPPLHLQGTPFRMAVWEILLQIPYGQTTTYNEIAKQIAKKRGLSGMSAQAVGGAVGHNEISIIVPCHRVVGSNGSLTGYAGGVDKKAFMLKLEGADMKNLFIPTKGTAL